MLRLLLPLALLLSGAGPQDRKLKTFLEATWDAESGEKLYERLQGAGRTCHELFRD